MSVDREKSIWKTLSQPKFLILVILGFVSGLPLALSASTLFVWMREVGVDLTTIGLFAALGLPYAFKFVWSPLVDHLRLPVLTRMFGRRRSWMLFSQMLLILAILALGQTSPGVDPGMTALAAFTVAFLSATQDIVIDAFRVEKLEKREQGIGAVAVVYGYRIGMLASGAGALFLADIYSWGVAYTAMAGLILIGMIAVLVSSEPEASAIAEKNGKPKSPRAWLQHAVIDPFGDFMTRRGWVFILLFIVFFKFGDALAGTMTNPFVVDLGFTVAEIAGIVKLFGVLPTMAGLALGGIMLLKVSLFRSLIICFIVQIASTIMFVVQANVGYNLELLAATIAAENLASGMGTAVFIAYLSILCNVRYTATQYALFSSLFAISRTLLSTGSGFLAQEYGWATFFILTMVAAIPGITLLFIIRKYDAQETERKIFT